MTNYMTVLEHEINMATVRLWRLKQAIEKPHKDFIHDRIDDALMKMRYETTLRLFRIMLAQGYYWEGLGEDEKKKACEEMKDPEELLGEEEPDLECAESMYRDALYECEEFGPSYEFLDILYPQGWYGDLSEDRKKEFRDNAEKALKGFYDAIGKAEKAESDGR